MPTIIDAKHAADVGVIYRELRTLGLRPSLSGDKTRVHASLYIDDATGWATVHDTDYSVTQLTDRDCAVILYYADTERDALIGVIRTYLAHKPDTTHDDHTLQEITA